MKIIGVKHGTSWGARIVLPLLILLTLSLSDCDCNPLDDEVTPTDDTGQPCPELKAAATLNIDIDYTDIRKPGEKVKINVGCKRITQKDCPAALSEEAWDIRLEGTGNPAGMEGTKSNLAHGDWEITIKAIGGDHTDIILNRTLAPGTTSTLSISGDPTSVPAGDLQAHF